MKIDTLIMHRGLINETFPAPATHRVLKRVEERDKISLSFEKKVVAYLAKNFDCVEPIFYSNSCHSYHY